jgi:hypothetical protein
MRTAAVPVCDCVIGSGHNNPNEAFPRRQKFTMILFCRTNPNFYII